MKNQYHYVNDNYPYYSIINAKNKTSFTKEEKEIMLDILSCTFRSCNFKFFKNRVLPFINNNPQFVHDNIFDIICLSFNEMSCFFSKEFLKYPGIDINQVCNDDSYLISAVEEIQMLLNIC